MLKRILLFLAAALPAVAAESDAESALKNFRLPAGFKAEVFASEPMLANPVAFTIDEGGRVFVAETHRHSAVGPAYRYYEGVFDIRSHMDWLDDDLASRSVADRIQLLQKHLGTNFAKVTNISERIRLLEDRNHDGKADFTSVFAENFGRAADGIGAGLLARKGSLYYTCIPDLWLLRDVNTNGVADFQQSLHTGFGAHIAFLGHDLHGLRIGPDGRLYFSVGDRGLNVVTREGKALIYPDEGAVLRCELDGSKLEVFARGFRNPQELAFDDYGNLFTGDNNSDGGDRARWVYVVEGGDSGWRIGYQTLTAPPRRGPWNAERLWHPFHEGQPAYIVPPVANLGYGPSGLAHYPGTGLPEKYRGRFFLCDFRGGASSGIHSFDVKPKGAGFELGAYEQFVWECLPTDVEFGVDGGIYFSDWVESWNKTGKGRIYHVYDPAHHETNSPSTRLALSGDLTEINFERLRPLLSHPDQRVRLETQFAYVALGEPGVSRLSAIVMARTNQFAMLHAVWGLGQAARKGNANAQLSLLVATRSPDTEVRCQAIKMLGEATIPQAGPIILPLLDDPEPRVQFHAAISLGRLKHAPAQPALLRLLEQNDNRDPFLRHAAIMGLEGIADRDSLRAAARHKSPAVRLGACVALRRLEDAAVADFLNDQEILVAAEAARAINDVPIEAAFPQLAALIARTNLLSASAASTNSARRTGVEAAISAITVETGTTTPAEQVFQRVINANFRLGAPANALALADFSMDASLPERLRAEALGALADWAKPSGRDRVMNLWRPLRPRDPAPARAALAKAGSLLDEPSEAIQLAAISAVRKLGIAEATPRLMALAKNAAAMPAVRIEALKNLPRSDLPAAMESALASSHASLQAEAMRILAETDPAAALKRIKDQLGSDSIQSRRAALNALAVLPAGEADQVLADLLDRKIAAELQLDLLDAAGKRQSREVLDRVQRFEKSRRQDDALGAFRECLEGGDPDEGRKIFYERAEVFCSRCHQLNGEGGEAGPKLTGIGSRQSREYLLESIILPNNKIAQGWENVVITLQDGRSFAGSVKNETDTQILLNSPEDGDVTVKKSEIKSRNRALSAMPDEFRQILTKQEIRHLVEFLATAK